MDEVQKYEGNFFSPLIIPFQQENSILRTGLCVLMSLVPILNLVYLTGYKHHVMIDTIQQKEIPSEPMNILPILKYGLIITTLSIIFYTIPIVCMFLLGLSPLVYLLALSDVFSGTLSFGDWFLGLIVRCSILIVWQILLGPIFMSAQMQYAKHGSILTFLNIPFHIYYVLRNIIFFIKAEIFSLLFWALAFIVELVIAPTGIGLFLWPPFVAAIYIISSGYEYGVQAKSM